MYKSLSKKINEYLIKSLAGASLFFSPSYSNPNNLENKVEEEEQFKQIIDDDQDLQNIITNPYGDSNGDNFIDLADYQAFNNCITGPSVGNSEPLTAECQIFDFDLNNDIDLKDFCEFQKRFNKAVPGWYFRFLYRNPPGSDIPPTFNFTDYVGSLVNLRTEMTLSVNDSIGFIRILDTGDQELIAEYKITDWDIQNGRYGNGSHIRTFSVSDRGQQPYDLVETIFYDFEIANEYILSQSGIDAPAEFDEQANSNLNLIVN